MNDYLVIVILSLLSIFSTVIGIILAYLCVRCVRHNKAVVFGMGFSAGIMILISVFELLPESVSEAGFVSSFLAFISGIIFFWLINILLPHIHLASRIVSSKNGLIKVAYLVALGLLIHDFPEGFAMANSYLISPQLGILIALGIAIHNIPEEFAIAVPLILSKKTKTLMIVGILSAMAEPAGALAGITAVHYFARLNFFFLSFAAGAMIFISLHELIPEALRYKQKTGLIGGILFSFLIYLMLVKFINV